MLSNSRTFCSAPSYIRDNSKTLFLVYHPREERGRDFREQKTCFSLLRIEAGGADVRRWRREMKKMSEHWNLFEPFSSQPSLCSVRLSPSQPSPSTDDCLTNIKIPSWISFFLIPREICKWNVVFGFLRNIIKFFLPWRLETSYLSSQCPSMIV